MLVEGVELVLHVEGKVGLFEGELPGEFLVNFFVGFAFEVGLELVVGAEVVLNLLWGLVVFGVVVGFEFAGFGGRLVGVYVG